LTPKAVQLAEVGPSGLTLRLDLDVNNPNAFPLVVNSVEGTLELASGLPLATATAAPQTTIPAKGSAPVTSTLAIPWSGLHALLPFASSPEPVPYRVVGSARLGSERLNVSVPFTLSGALTRAQLVEIGLRGLAR
jgi:hypothetical protein